MAIFRPKPWVNLFGKMSIFRLFELLDFTAQKGLFPFQNIMKDIFLAYIAKKKSLKNGHFWTKTMGKPLWKNVNFSTFSTYCFHSLERLFSVLEYHKRYFPGLYCIKNKIGKMAIFGPKPWVIPFGKMSFFHLFELVVFILQNNVFPFWNRIKDIFLAFIT